MEERLLLNIREKRAMMKNHTDCTGIANGKIIELKVKGQDFGTIIKVQYEVSEKNYTIEESIKLKSEKIKLGFLTVGQKRTPVMKNTTVGTTVRVMFNPYAPEEAYLPDNVGKANI